MKPTANRLLVKVEEEIIKEGEEKQKGNKVMIAEVLKMGPNVSKEIKIGDRVVFSPFGFDEVEVKNPDGNTEKLVVIEEVMILAIYE